jgi:hypothetical protein
MRSLQGPPTPCAPATSHNLATSHNPPDSQRIASQIQPAGWIGAQQEWRELIDWICGSGWLRRWRPGNLGEPSAPCSTPSPRQNAPTTSAAQDMLQPKKITLSKPPTVEAAPALGRRAEWVLRAGQLPSTLRGPARRELHGPRHAPLIVVACSQRRSVFRTSLRIPMNEAVFLQDPAMLGRTVRLNGDSGLQIAPATDVTSSC